MKMNACCMSLLEINRLTHLIKRNNNYKFVFNELLLSNSLIYLTIKMILKNLGENIVLSCEHLLFIEQYMRITN